VPAAEKQWGASRRGASGCQPGRRFSRKVPAQRAVRCQPTELGGGRWRDDEQATSPNRPKGHSQGFWDKDEADDRDITNPSFPYQTYKPSKRRPTGTASLRPWRRL